MKKKAFIHRDEEGVSPVIATILMVAITVVLAAVLYIMVIGLGGGSPPPPTGTLQPPQIVGPDAVDIDFGRISGEQPPMNLEFVLELNGTIEGKYKFSSNNDGDLTFSDGTDICDMMYLDLADNEIVNLGDGVKLTELYSGSRYEISLIYSPTGDRIDSKTFSTPGF